MNKNDRAEVLIVDDHPANLKILCDTLENEDHSVAVATNGKSALKAATDALPDIILLDIMMPDMDGYEVCRRLKANEATKHIPVIFVTVKDEKESLLEGFQAGGVDYITKPFENEEVLQRVKTHLEINRLRKALEQRNTELEGKNAELIQLNQNLQQEIQKRKQAEDAFQKVDETLSVISQQEAQRFGIVGKSEAIRKIISDVRRLQKVDSTSVLISGESGTGKELIAGAIHFGGTRAKGPFIPVNCSAIPSNLAESLLFGHEKGAFTGADAKRKGYFERADGGTLFLDEIGDMSLELQAKLLRALDEGYITPLGGSHQKPIDVRVLAATNQDLEKKIAESTFRNELYFRISGFRIEVPPLRARREDIPLLVEHFLSMLAEEMGREKASLSKTALSVVESYHFPGNVRELKNIIEHAIIKSDGSQIQPEHLPLINSYGNISMTNQFSEVVPGLNTGTTQTPQSNTQFSLSPQNPQSLMVKGALAQTDGDVENAAALLGVSPAYVLQLMQHLGDDSPSPRTDEERILWYVKEKGSINNAECCQFLNVAHGRASYLLKKMHAEGLLKREGERRWAQYCLP